MLFDTSVHAGIVMVFPYSPRLRGPKHRFRRPMALRLTPSTPRARSSVPHPSLRDCPASISRDPSITCADYLHIQGHIPFLPFAPRIVFPFITPKGYSPAYQARRPPIWINPRKPIHEQPSLQLLAKIAENDTTAENAVWFVRCVFSCPTGQYRYSVCL